MARYPFRPARQAGTRANKEAEQQTNPPMAHRACLWCRPIKCCWPAPVISRTRFLRSSGPSGTLWTIGADRRSATSWGTRHKGNGHCRSGGAAMLLYCARPVANAVAVKSSQTGLLRNGGGFSPSGRGRRMPCERKARHPRGSIGDRPRRRTTRSGHPLRPRDISS